MNPALTMIISEAVTDQYISFVSLLMHMEGANAGTTFTDVKGHTMSQGTGTNVLTSTAHAAFGTSSMQCASGGYLSTPNATEFAFGSGNFTIDAWLYPTSFAATMDIVGNLHSNDTNTSWTFKVASTGKLRFSTWFLNVLDGATALTLNAWNHVSVVRSGSNLTFYVNGVQDATVGSVSINLTNTSGGLWIGYDQEGYFSGFIDELRITKGVARYLGSTLPVPVAAYPNL